MIERRQPRLPAGFDLGEAHKIVVLSVTEGEEQTSEVPRYVPRRFADVAE
jgi:Ni2+-binding GTPase involved in maturation of urease and hydrogenase